MSGLPHTPDQALDGDITDAGAALRAGAFTIADLVGTSLDRVALLGNHKAFIDVFAAEAMHVARQHQGLLDAGYDLGPLHGLPIALKDNIDMAGRRTTAGSRVLADKVATHDATLVRALKRAGAIIVGKNNLHEFAWGGTTANAAFGHARNPWNLDHSPAGSSGGSAIAVATRAVFAAIGTDTGGSIRTPAAFNGISGLRPTIGRVSNSGVFPLAWSLDTSGPLAKSARDCALILSEISGHDPSDRQSAERPPGAVLGAIDQPLSGITFGLIENYSQVAIEPGVARAFEQALRQLEELGARCVSLPFTDLEALTDAMIVIDAAEPSAIHGPLLAHSAARYGEDVRAQLEAGFVFSAVDYIQAQRYRAHVAEQFQIAFRRVDVVLTPTIAFTAPRIGQHEVEIDGQKKDILANNMQFSALASLSGLPAISVPIGLDEKGLPVGLQIIGGPFDEASILRFGHALQRVTEHHLMAPLARARPPISAGA